MKKKALLEDRLCSSPQVGLQKSNLEREKCPRRSKPENEEQMDYLQPSRSLRETAENINAKNHPWQQKQQRTGDATKRAFTNNASTVHVDYNSWYISLPSLQNNNMK